MRAQSKSHRSISAVGRLGRFNRALVAGALLVVGLSGVIQTLASQTAGAEAVCTSTSFSDDFTTDDSLSGCWQQETPLIGAFEQKIDATDVAPLPSFGATGLDMAAADGTRQFSAIQSSSAYSAPFTFSTDVATPTESFGSAIGIYAVSANLSQALSVEGNFNPDATAPQPEGIWANVGLTADGTGTDLVASPTEDVTYQIVISVDASGNATVAVHNQGAVAAPVPIGNVGTGPFYFLLGQNEGTPNAQVLADQASAEGEPNIALWLSADLNPCSASSLSDDFATDGSLSSCWQAGTTFINTVATDLGDAAQSVGLTFGNNFGLSTGYMDMTGTGNDGQFTAIQSANAYQAPFQFNSTVTFGTAIRGDAWAIYLVDSANPTEAFSVQADSNSSLPDYGVFASNALGVPENASGTPTGATVVNATPDSGPATYNVTMTIDAAGNGTISMNGGPALPVGHVGLGSFYVLLGQREDHNTFDPGGQDARWYSASLSPNYCSAASNSVFEDFTTDAGLNSSCWTPTPPALLSSLVGAGAVTPQLSFGDGGMSMSSGGSIGAPVVSGIQSTLSYTAPFDFQTTVSGSQSDGDAFSVYLLGDDAANSVAVEANLTPGNGPNYGLWDSQAGIPAGFGQASEDLIPAPSEGTRYVVSISVNSAGVASVDVNGVASSDHVNVGTGPFSLVLGQRDATGLASSPDTALWYNTSLGPEVVPSLSAALPTVASVESAPASAIPGSSLSATPASGSADPASAPLSSIPLASSPLSSIPLSSIPLSSIALPSSGDTAVPAAQAALASTALSDISVSYPAGCGGASAPACTGWGGILAGTVYASSPLQSVTLEDVLANGTTSSRFNSVNLGALNLSTSPLSSIPLSSIPLSSIPLSSIPLPGVSGGTPLAQWCTELGSLGSNCSDFGISGANDNGVTLLTLALAGVPLSSIPLSSIPLSSIPLSSINLAASPLSSIPLSSISLASNPLSSIPLSSIALSFTPLSSIPLSSIPLSSIPLSSILLGSVPLSSIPLSSIPLSSIALGATPLSSIPLSSIALGSTPLSSIPLSSIPLSSIPLSSIPLSSIAASATGDISAVVSCFSGTCATLTLGQALLAGDILPGATLGDLGTYGSTTLGQLGTYGATTLGELGTYGPTTLGQLGGPGSVTLAELGPYGSGTLGQLGTYGAMTLGELGTYGSTTLAQLLANLTTTAPGFPDVTLGDLLLSTVPPASFSWQSLSLASLPLAADGTGGGTATYSAHFTATSPTTQQVSVVLPPTFAYVPGSSTLSGNPVPDPSSSSTSSSSGQALQWTLTLPVGTDALQFEANAGIGLGPAVATLTLNGDATSTSAEGVDVFNAEQPGIDSPTTALPLSAGTPPFTNGNLNIGYLSSPGDLNDWSVPVTQGEELSLALTNLPATYDLELFGPSGQQLQGTPSQDLSGVTDTLPSLDPGSTTEPSTGSQDLPITPPAGDSLQAISNNPDAQDQFIQTPPLPGGTYIVQVSGYNGAYSSEPYLLRANLLSGATAPSCPSIVYPNPMPAAASGPVSVPSGVNTLFLVDTQRLSAAFGASAEATIMSDLQSLSSDSAAGVTGAIIPVDAYPAVQAAYGTWGPNPCSVSGANGVVTAISSVVDQLTAAHPSVQNLVIVGADDQVPFARLADGATQSNERDYGASTFAGENNVEADALSLGYYFSDDPYASPQPLGVGSATLYTPQLAVGRLVESAAEIESALTRYVQSDGDLNSKYGLTTGYSFLTSGADAVQANLAANGLVPSVSASELINESWTEAQLASALTAGQAPGVDSINAHFDYSRALPADEDTSGADTDLFTTTDIRNSISSYAGRLLFSMGCHSGLDVDDAEIAASGVTTPVDDWAKTFADAGALWVGNTGYGYADTDTIAYSARLMAEFAANLNGPLTIGEALTQAKQQYAAGNAILSPYDLKALMESTLYGLPMYNLNQPSAPTPPPPPPATTVVNPTTGLTDLSTPISVGLSTGPNPGQLGLVNGTTGQYYQVNGSNPYNGGTQTTEYRPIEPLFSATVTEPGLAPHGALVTGLTSHDIVNFTPAYSEPAAGSAGSVAPQIGDAAFPGTLQRVATYSTFTSGGTGQGAQLDLVTGQFLPSATTPATGAQRLFTSLQAQVYYLPVSSPYAGDFTSPTIVSAQAPSTAASLSFEVQVAPSTAPVQQVVVLYTDASSPGSWSLVSLSPSGGQNWTGTGTPTPSGQVQYIVEALDAAGNVAVSDNEGTAFSGSALANISVTLSGNGPTNGFYTGPVTAAISAPPGSTYVLDGSTPAAVPGTGTVTVTSPGEHTLTVTGPPGNSGTPPTTTETFAISLNQTTTALSSNPSSVLGGQTATLMATVSAASSGVGTPSTGDVEFFDGTAPISTCTSAPLGASGTAVCPVSYSAAGTHHFVAEYQGGGIFSGSTSSPVSLTVNLRSATVSTFKVAGSPATYGAETSLVFSATVTAGDKGPFPTSDTLTVANGPTVVCTMTLTAGSGPASNTGSGSCSPSSGSVLKAGSYAAITGTFNSTGADPAFQAAAPATVALVVGRATPKMTWAPQNLDFGAPLTSAQLDATANVPGAYVYLPAAGTVLQPGPQILALVFTPNDTTDYTTAVAFATVTVGFSQPCITSTHTGPLTVASGQAVCISSGGRVTGTVRVSTGGALYVNGGSITGPVNSSGALAITLTGAAVTGAVSIANTSGPVVIGGLGSTADTLTGTLSIVGNSGGLVLLGSSVTGSLGVLNNSNGVLVSLDTVGGSATVNNNSGGVAFAGNTIYGSLTITYNTGIFLFAGNTVHGSVTNKDNS